MKRVAGSVLHLIAFGWFTCSLISPARCVEFESKTSPELVEARRTGWQLGLLVVEKLRGGDADEFPGIAAWLQDFDGAAKGMDIAESPKRPAEIDVELLVTRNPNYWRAFYEIAPGDPGLALLHAGLLLNSGEADRATQLITLARQRPGTPQAMRRAFDILQSQCQQGAAPSLKIVDAGVKLHDAGDYSGARAKYAAALEAWPQNGLAHFEVGMTLYFEHLQAKGEKAPALGTIQVNGGGKLPDEVVKAYAKARQHDPFQIKAYQGSDQEVIQGFMALGEQGMSAWQQIARRPGQAVPDGTLEKLAKACQMANNHELALWGRQILVARRNGFRPEDHPLIATSLRKLAPGNTTEATLERLAGSNVQLRQLIAPER